MRFISGLYLLSLSLRIILSVDVAWAPNKKVNVAFVDYEAPPYNVASQGEGKFDCSEWVFKKMWCIVLGSKSCLDLEESEAGP